MGILLSKKKSSRGLDKEALMEEEAVTKNWESLWSHALKNQHVILSQSDFAFLMLSKKPHSELEKFTGCHPLGLILTALLLYC